jgi:uncharacterized protein
MPLNAHDVSVALFVRGLVNLRLVLSKAEAHAAVSGMNPLELIDAQLAPDMFKLGAQVHWAAEGAKLAVARLLGAAAVPATGEARSFAELFERIDTTITHLRAFAPQDLEAGLARSIEIEHRGGSMKFSGVQFLTEFAIPSFYFHVTTAYSILRFKGVEITKGDFLGSAR